MRWHRVIAGVRPSICGSMVVIGELLVAVGDVLSLSNAIALSARFPLVETKHVLVDVGSVTAAISTEGTWLSKSYTPR